MLLEQKREKNGCGKKETAGLDAGWREKKFARLLYLESNQCKRVTPL
jgi:hypothetical protein